MPRYIRVNKTKPDSEVRQRRKFAKLGEVNRMTALVVNHNNILISVIPLRILRVDDRLPGVGREAPDISEKVLHSEARIVG